RIPQRQCSSRVSDSRDAYRGEEQHGPLALGPVGLGHIPDIVRTRIKKRSLAVHLQGGDKGVTLRTVAWSTWSSAQVGREVSVAARSSRGWPTRRAGGQCRAQLNYRHDLARNRRFNCRWTDRTAVFQTARRGFVSSCQPDTIDHRSGGRSVSFLIRWGPTIIGINSYAKLRWPKNVLFRGRSREKLKRAKMFASPLTPDAMMRHV